MAGAGTKKRAKQKKAKIEKQKAASKTEKERFRQKFDNFIARFKNWILIVSGIFVLAVLAAIRFSFYYVEGVASIALLIFAFAFLWRNHDFICPLEFCLSFGELRVFRAN